MRSLDTVRTSGGEGEKLAKRWIEDQGFEAHDANILFRANCPNIDLVAYGRRGAVFVQVKSSERPAGSDCVVIDGSPWSTAQLYENAPIFNKHDHFEASFVIVVDRLRSGDVQFYVIPPKDLEALARVRGITFAEKPKRDGGRRSIGFRKELPRMELVGWLGRWELLGEPLRQGPVGEVRTFEERSLLSRS